uniref:Uncharacterized protein n=1 Tax=Anguilla anguilla TaxID=7936 RepID=A0A0E9Q4S5_ANGAN
MLLLLPEDGLQKLEEVICRKHVAKWLKWMKKKDIKCMFPNSLSQHHTHSRTS